MHICVSQGTKVIVPFALMNECSMIVFYSQMFYFNSMMFHKITLFSERISNMTLQSMASLHNI